MWSRGSNPTSPYPLFPPGTTTPPSCPHHLEALFSISRLRFSLISPLLRRGSLPSSLEPKVVTHPPIGYHGFGNSSSGSPTFLHPTRNRCETPEIRIQITNSGIDVAVIGPEMIANAIGYADTFPPAFKFPWCCFLADLPATRMLGAERTKV